MEETVMANSWLDAELELARRKANDEASRHTYAVQSGDFAGASQAQRELAQMGNRIVNWRRLKTSGNGSSNINNTRDQRQPASAEEMIASMPALTNRERQWLREHPDTITNPANQRRLEVAYLDAQAQALWQSAILPRTKRN
jgi:hypothetical protein